MTAFFPELDRRYPGSRFILTLRGIEGWLRSMEAHFERRGPQADGGAGAEIRRLVFGRVVFEREHFRAAFEAHTARVRGYFKGRPEDLLEMDIPGGDGWEKLCPFLGCAVPGVSFPRRNERPERRARDRYYTRTITGPGLGWGTARPGG